MMKLNSLLTRFALLQAPSSQTASRRTCCHDGLVVSHQMSSMQCMPKSQMKRSGATHVHVLSVWLAGLILRLTVHQ